MTEAGAWEGGCLVEDVRALSWEGFGKRFGVKDFSEVLRF